MAPDPSSHTTHRAALDVRRLSMAFALRSLLPIVAFATISASPLSAQIPGNVDVPVRPGITSTSVALDAAQGLTLDSGESLYLGARVLFPAGSSVVWFGGGYAGMASGAENLATGGGGVAVPLMDGGSVTLAFEGGVGATRRFGSWLWGATSGLTLWLAPVDATLAPFVKAHGLAVHDFETDFGVSALGGLALRTGAGPEIQLALQWEHVEIADAVVVGASVRLGT